MSLAQKISKASSLLADSNVVGLPTETVYGLAARVDRPEGIRRIFTTKERPFFDPLIVHVLDANQAQSLTKEWPLSAEILSHAFWPGPLTLVLPKNASVDDTITSGLETVGLRQPDHPVALKLLKETGVPLAAPSANRFGRTSPTSKAHVDEEFGDSVFTLDGGSCRVGIESTVLLIRPQSDGSEGLSILRQGTITATQIERELKKYFIPFEWLSSVEKHLSPGHMKHHYMPDVPLIWTEGTWSEEDFLAEVSTRLRDLPDAVEGVKIKKLNQAPKSFSSLRLAKNPAIAARELYSLLREAALSGKDILRFQKEPYMQGEAWAATLDRLSKAASLVLLKTSASR